MSDSTSSPRDGHASGSHYQPSLSIVFIIVVLFVGATFLMVRAVSPSSGGTPTTTVPANGSTTTTIPRIVKSKVRVQVANGTNITNLAAHYTQILTTQDWDTLPPVNGPHVTATIVYYTGTYHDAALEVASAIKISSSVVHPLAGRSPVTGASTDGVIVVLGPNSRI